MVGVDYSERSVEFAKRIWKGRRREELDGQKVELEDKQEETPEATREDGETAATSTAPSSSKDDSNDTDKRERNKLTFHTFDILQTVPSRTTTPWLSTGFDIVLDKGTFDAISLSSDLDTSGHRAFERYGAKVEPLVKVGGYFVIVSCNWTEEEVRRWFESPGLRWRERVKFPSFRFGGREGSTVCCVCFRRVDVGGDGQDGGENGNSS